MRIVFVFLLYHISIATSAQSGMADQIKALFDDAPNGFQKYLGTKKPGTDTASSVYNTNIVIEGTIDNDIFIDSMGYMYSASEKCCLSRKEAKQIIETWKKQLKGIFGPFIHQERAGFHGLIAEDFEYVKGNTTLTLTFFTSGNSAKYMVAIHISYYPKKI